MAIELTPLGFKKPDGMTELVKRGAQVIADNAQKAEDRIQEMRGRLALIESGTAASGIAVDPTDPDTLLVSTGTNIAADPSDTDVLLITT